MKRDLLIALVVAALMRILFAIPSFVDKSRVYSVADATGYELLAVNLLEHGTLSLSESPPYEPDALRTPLYPLFISGIYSVFGRRPRAVVILQIAVSALTALLVYAIAMSINSKIALTAAILFGLSPNIAFYSTMLLTEVLFTSLLLAAVAFLLAGIGSDGSFRMFLAGIFLGLSTLTRPISLYFPFLVAIPVVWMYRKNLKRGVVLLSLFLGAYVAVLSPWLLRNVGTHDRLMFTTAGELNIFYYHGAMVKAAHEGVDVDDARRELEFEAIQKAKKSGVPLSHEARVSSTRRQIAVRYLRDFPLIYVGLHAAGFLSSYLLPVPLNPLISYFTPVSERPQLRRSVTQDALASLTSGKLIEATKLVWNERIRKIPPAALFVYIVAGIFQYAVIVGLLLSLTTLSLRLKYSSVLLLSIVYFTAIPGPLAGPRFRAPIEPLLIMIASYGFHRKLRKGQVYKPSSVSRLGRDGDH